MNYIYIYILAQVVSLSSQLTVNQVVSSKHMFLLFKHQLIEGPNKQKSNLLFLRFDILSLSKFCLYIYFVFRHCVFICTYVYVCMYVCLYVLREFSWLFKNESIYFVSFKDIWLIQKHLHIFFICNFVFGVNVRVT